MAFTILTSKPVVLLSALGTITGGAVILKNYLVDPKYEGKERLDGKTVIVTGANTGIGKEVSRDLLFRGAEVIMACRDMKKCMKTRREILAESDVNKDLKCAHLDLSSLKSVREFASHIKEAYPSIDILVNNAGVMGCPRTVTEDGFETHLGVNHLGPFLLTNLLADHIKDRIVNVSSLSHFRGTINFTDLNSEVDYDPEKAYNQSKLANLLFVQQLAKKMEGTGVKVCAVAPGMVNTNITRHMLESKYAFMRPFYRLTFFLIFQSPIQGAQCVIRTCLDPDLKNGAFYWGSEAKEPSKEALDDKLATKMWLTSEKWTAPRQCI